MNREVESRWQQTRPIMYKHILFWYIREFHSICSWYLTYTSFLILCSQQGPDHIPVSQFFLLLLFSSSNCFLLLLLLLFGRLIFLCFFLCFVFCLHSSFLQLISIFFLLHYSSHQNFPFSERLISIFLTLFPSIRIQLFPLKATHSNKNIWNLEMSKYGGNFSDIFLYFCSLHFH